MVVTKDIDCNTAKNPKILGGNLRLEGLKGAWLKEPDWHGNAEARSHNNKMFLPNKRQPVANTSAPDTKVANNLSVWSSC